MVQVLSDWQRLLIVPCSSHYCCCVYLCDSCIMWTASTCIFSDITIKWQTQIIHQIKLFFKWHQTQTPNSCIGTNTQGGWNMAILLIIVYISNTREFPHDGQIKVFWFDGLCNHDIVFISFFTKTAGQFICQKHYIFILWEIEKLTSLDTCF